MDEAEFLSALRSLVEADPFLHEIGVKVRDLGVGHAELSVELEGRLTRAGGIMNGGAVATLADAAGGAAVLSTAAADGVPVNEVTVHLDASYLRPISKGPVVARAEVVRRGSALAFVRVEVLDGDGELCSTVEGVYRVLRIGP